MTVFISGCIIVMSHHCLKCKRDIFFVNINENLFLSYKEFNSMTAFHRHCHLDCHWVKFLFMYTHILNVYFVSFQKLSLHKLYQNLNWYLHCTVIYNHNRCVIGYRRRPMFYGQSRATSESFSAYRQRHWIQLRPWLCLCT